MSDITICNYNPFPTYKSAPLSQLYLVSVLRERGYDVDFRDFQILDDPTKEKLLSLLEDSSDI